jgi:hypothetical protein
MSDTGDYLANSSTLNLITLAEHLVTHGQRDLGFALLLAEVMMVLNTRLPASALARIKDDLRGQLDGRRQQGVSQ